MTHDEKIVEAVARAICVAQGNDPDATYNISVPVIVSGRLTDTGHDTRITEKRDRVTAPAWHRFTRAARAAITAYQAEAWQGHDALREAAEEFCRRVEAGEVRSKRSYAAFKQALALLPPAPKATPDRSELRCLATGNLVGTDTWQVGRPCRCANCSAAFPKATP